MGNCPNRKESLYPWGRWKNVSIFKTLKKFDKYIQAVTADHSGSTDRSNYPKTIRSNWIGWLEHSAGTGRWLIRLSSTIKLMWEVRSQGLHFLFCTELCWTVFMMPSNHVWMYGINDKLTMPVPTVGTWISLGSKYPALMASWTRGEVLILLRRKVLLLLILFPLLI